MQKMIGWILTVCSIFIIITNAVQYRENIKQADAHPWITLFTGGKNLMPAYSFTPPLTAYELVVIGLLICGLFLIYRSSKSPTPSQLKEDD